LPANYNFVEPKAAFVNDDDNQSVSEIAHAKCGRLPVNLWQPKKGLGCGSK
jgi:hypothetical protein